MLCKETSYGIRRKSGDWVRDGILEELSLQIWTQNGSKLMRLALRVEVFALALSKPTQILTASHY
jgi:hypothetical protein